MHGLFSGLKHNDDDAQAAATPVQNTASNDYEELCERVHLGTARMKTHFIGNMMTALHYLCEADAEKAQDSILALFGYLRQSVEGINRKELLPFSWELAHAQNYVTLETLRFEERLQAAFEIDEKEFDVPSLTLQPLVENAVKHGLASITERPTTIVVTTCRLEDGSVQISVSDNGAGFDTAILEDPKYADKSLACIAKRLKRDVGGSLRVQSAPGQGTTATVTLPPRA